MDGASNIDTLFMSGLYVCEKFNVMLWILERIKIILFYDFLSIIVIFMLFIFILFFSVSISSEKETYRFLINELSERSALFLVWFNLI